MKPWHITQFRHLVGANFDNIHFRETIERMINILNYGLKFKYKHIVSGYVDEETNPLTKYDRIDSNTKVHIN